MVHDQHCRSQSRPPLAVDAYVDAELAMAEIVIQVQELLATLSPQTDIQAELDEISPDVWALNLLTRDGAILSGIFTAHLPSEGAEWLVFLRPAGRGPEATVSRPMRTPEVTEEIRSFVADALRRGGDLTAGGRDEG